MNSLKSLYFFLAVNNGLPLFKQMLAEEKFLPCRKFSSRFRRNYLLLGIVKVPEYPSSQGLETAKPIGDREGII